MFTFQNIFWFPFPNSWCGIRCGEPWHERSTSYLDMVVLFYDFDPKAQSLDFQRCSAVSIYLCRWGDHELW